MTLDRMSISWLATLFVVGCQSAPTLPTVDHVDLEGYNAEWGMRFVWPTNVKFLLVWLDEDYTQTVIGRSKRDYVWIMAREPTLPEADYQRILEFLAAEGYDLDAIRMAPQSWPAAS